MTDVEVHIKMLIDMKITVNSEWKTKLCLYYVIGIVMKQIHN